MADPTDSLAPRATDLLTAAGGGFPSLPGSAFASTSAPAAAQGSTDAIGLQFAIGFAPADLPSRGRAAPSGHDAPPRSFAPSEADELARNLSQSGSAVDPTAPQPGLPDPAPPARLVSPAPGVPEPSTWLLLIAGAFGVGASLRRRTFRLAV